MKKINEAVVVLEDGNKKGLYELCKKYNIGMPFEEIFLDDNKYYLFLICNFEIGLCSTIIAKNSKKIIHGLEELTYLLQNC